jgi:hypothetical protein
MIQTLVTELTTGRYIWFRNRKYRIISQRNMLGYTTLYTAPYAELSFRNDQYVDLVV